MASAAVLHTTPEPQPDTKPDPQPNPDPKTDTNLEDTSVYFAGMLVAMCTPINGERLQTDEEIFEKNWDLYQRINPTKADTFVERMNGQCKSSPLRIRHLMLCSNHEIEAIRAWSETPTSESYAYNCILPWPFATSFDDDLQLIRDSKLYHDYLFLPVRVNFQSASAYTPHGKRITSHSLQVNDIVLGLTESQYRQVHYHYQDLVAHVKASQAGSYYCNQCCPSVVHHSFTYARLQEQSNGNMMIPHRAIGIPPEMNRDDRRQWNALMRNMWRAIQQQDCTVSCPGHFIRDHFADKNDILDRTRLTAWAENIMGQSAEEDQKQALEDCARLGMALCGVNQSQYRRRESGRGTSLGRTPTLDDYFQHAKHVKATSKKK